MKIKTIMSTALSFMLLTSSFFVTYADTTADITYEDDLRYLERVLDFVISNYQYEIDEEEVIESLYDGFFELLDEYSVYYTQEEYASFTSNLEGSFGGVGFVFTIMDGKLVVTDIIEGTPAEKIGLLPMDEIISVNGESVIGFSLEQTGALIKGEIGTEVVLGILRNDTELSLIAERELITSSDVSSEIIDETIGYIKIDQFTETVPSSVEKVLKSFDEKGITDVVVDLRNNPGGILDSAVELLNFFVEQGPVLHVDSTALGEKTYYSYLEEDEVKYDLCVLVNENSASASEIFAGAIQDRDSGEIIGTNTFGKGVVQGLYPLTDGSAVKFTTSEYFTPNKNKVQGVGITPDIIVENTQSEPLVDLENYPKLNNDRVAVLNTVGLDVLGAEMILETLGYAVETPDGILDVITFEQIKSFQQNNNIEVTGELNFDTQNMLTDAINTYAIPKSEDLQLDAAINLLKAEQ